MDTVAHARARVAAVRHARVRTLRDTGLAAQRREDGLREARAVPTAVLRIAEPGDPAAAELRPRIDLPRTTGGYARAQC